MNRENFCCRKRSVVQRDFVHFSLEEKRLRRAGIDRSDRRSGWARESPPISMVSSLPDARGDQSSIEIDACIGSVEGQRQVMVGVRDEPSADAIGVAYDRGLSSIDICPSDQLIGQETGAAIADLQRLFVRAVLA